MFRTLVFGIQIKDLNGEDKYRSEGEGLTKFEDHSMVEVGD